MYKEDDTAVSISVFSDLRCLADRNDLSELTLVTADGRVAPDRVAAGAAQEEGVLIEHLLFSVVSGEEKLSFHTHKRRSLS